MFTLKINSRDASGNIEASTKKYVKGISNEVLNRMKGAGETIRSNVIKTLSGPRSGKIYKRANGKSHQASAPGEPPASDTGHLRNSFHAQTETEQRGRKLFVTAMAVSNTTKDAYGGKNKGRTPSKGNYAWIDVGMGNIAPRPYSKKVAEESYKHITELLSKKYHV